MTAQESTDARLARIEEHLKSIDEMLRQQVQLRHMNQEGVCDAYGTVIDHDRKINQWTGALATVALICAFIGSLIGVFLSKWVR